MAGRALAKFRKLAEMQRELGAVLRRFTAGIPEWVDRDATARFPRARAWRETRVALFLAAMRVSALVAEHADLRRITRDDGATDPNVEKFIIDFVNVFGGERLADLDFGKEWGDTDKLGEPDEPLTDADIAELLPDFQWEPGAETFARIPEGDLVGEAANGMAVACPTSLSRPQRDGSGLAIMRPISPGCVRGVGHVIEHIQNVETG